MLLTSDMLILAHHLQRNLYNTRMMKLIRTHKIVLFFIIEDVDGECEVSWENFRERMYSHHGVNKKWNTLILGTYQIENKYYKPTLSFILLEIYLRIISKLKSGKYEIYSCIKREGGGKSNLWCINKWIITRYWKSTRIKTYIINKKPCNVTII